MMGVSRRLSVVGAALLLALTGLARHKDAHLWLETSSTPSQDTSQAPPDAVQSLLASQRDRIASLEETVVLLKEKGTGDRDYAEVKEHAEMAFQDVQPGVSQVRASSRRPPPLRPTVRSPDSLVP
jgi:hypothetical protein